jgi:hypothetical protein
MPEHQIDIRRARRRTTDGPVEAIDGIVRLENEEIEKANRRRHVPLTYRDSLNKNLQTSGVRRHVSLVRNFDCARPLPLLTTDA